MAYLMIKSIKYSLLAEGIVENVFIPAFLNQLLPEKAKFTKSNLTIKSSSSPSKSKVLKKVSDFVKTSLIVLDEDLFIVGVDLDKPDHDLTHLKSQETELKGLIPDHIDASKVIIYIPIQAFDHWLLYQKYKVDRTARTADNSLESKDSNNVKKALYGTSRPDTYLIRKKANEILEAMSVSDLSKQSKSFKHFHKQIENYMEQKHGIVPE
jgi:hypothetical protein